MASPVTVTNTALAALGIGPITSLSDPSAAARLAQRTYEEKRDDFLRAHPWNFATKRIELAESATPPVWGYDHAYPLPEDCLRVLEIDGLQRYDWRVERTDDGRVLVTDADSPLNIRYIARIEEEELWDASFTQAFAYLLAVEWAPSLTGMEPSVLESLQRRAAIKLVQARTADGQEMTPEQIEATDWTDARI